MADPVLRSLTHLARKLQQRLSLEEILQLAAETAAEVAHTRSASVRLLDAAGERLLAVARAGHPLHVDQHSAWRRGEGLIGWVAQHVEPLVTGDAQRDPRFVARQDQRSEIGSFIGVPIVSNSVCLGVLSVTDVERDAFDESCVEALLLLATICAPHIEVARLSRLSSADPLTGVLNRRGLEELLQHAESTRTLSIVMVDLDHFKRVNDTYGHGVGDEVLRAVANRLAESVRVSDAVARVGGEEFMLVLPGITRTVAARIAERARHRIERSPITVGSRPIEITASFGVATRAEGESHEQTIARADEALYRAKAAGRNRVELAVRTSTDGDGSRS